MTDSRDISCFTPGHCILEGPRIQHFKLVFSKGLELRSWTEFSVMSKTFPVIPIITIYLSLQQGHASNVLSMLMWERALDDRAYFNVSDRAKKQSKGTARKEWKSRLYLNKKKTPKSIFPINHFIIPWTYRMVGTLSSVSPRVLSSIHHTPWRTLHICS